MSGLAEVHTPLVLRHHPDDMHLIEGREYRWFSTTEEGYLFARVDEPGIREAFTFEQFDRIRRARAYRFHRGWFDPGRITVRLRRGVAYIADLSDKLQATILFRMTVCTLVLQRIEDGRCRLSDASLEKNLPEIEDEVAHLENPLLRTKSGKLRKPRGGTTTKRTAVVGPKATRTWLKRLRKGGWDPCALIPHYDNCGPRTPIIVYEVRKLAIRFATKFAANPRPSKKQLYDAMELELDDLNVGRVGAGLEPFTMPSRNWFYARIRDLDAFYVEAGRYGPDAARKKFRITSGGLDVVRPLQRVELDEWEVSLMLLAIESGIWETLSAKERELVAREKCYLCIAICCATCCVVGFNLAPSASPDNALATLRMVLVDKGRFVDTLGALTPWDMCGKPELVVTDGGTSFANWRFRLALLMIGVNPMITPGGVPWLRGRAERIFRTIHTDLVARFTGRTFENVVRRGDYPAEREASLFGKDFRWALGRYLVDIYHNTPHEGLAGRTPLEVWRERVHLYNVEQPPDRETLRAAFGFRRSAVLDHDGVRFLALHYQSEALQAYRRKAAEANGTLRVDMRVDPQDLGAVSVQLGEDGPFLSVPCRTSGFDEISVATWMKSLADIRARFANPPALEVIKQTNRDIAAMQERAEAFAGVAPTTLTDAQLDQAEATLAFGFQLPADHDAPGDAAPSTTSELYDEGFEVGTPEVPVEPPAEEPPPPQKRDWSID